MPQSSKASPLPRILRIVVPILVLALGVGVFFALLRTGKTGTTPPALAPVSTPAPTSAATPPATPPATTAATPATPAVAGQPDATPAAPAPALTPATPAPALPTLATLAPKIQPIVKPAPIGGLDRDAKGKVTTPFNLQLTFSQTGAGLESLTLSRIFQDVHATSPQEVLQRIETHRIEGKDAAGNNRAIVRKLVPFAAFAIDINGQTVPLSGTDSAPVWKQLDPGVFEAEIVDTSGETIARITRRYVLEPGKYTLLLDQRIDNVSPGPLSVVWHQAGPGDVPVGIVRYGGDVRRVRVGYVGGPTSNPDGQVVSASKYLIAHHDMLGEPTDDTGKSWTDVNVWPQPDTATDNSNLSWAALTNRYFAVGVFALPQRQPARSDGLPSKVFSSVESIDRVVLGKGGIDKGEQIKAAVAALRTKSPAITIASGAAADISMGIYAGPITHTVIDTDAAAKSVNLGGLVVYTFGGPCAFCTFQFLTYALRWYLGLLHDYIFFDWALSIIFLVITVRTILHPVAKWSQTQISRFTKQMQKVAPKQAALKERYGNDPARLREEIAKLMREEQINYSGVLGCVPLLLQTPIWIALSAMVFFTFEFRHDGAFYGLFQKLTGDHWQFLSDLSEPDKFIPLGTSFSIPLISGFMGPIDSINLIPLMLGALFYLQQKYMMPPSTTPLTPEMEQQQKITKVMMVILMPFFMYNAPSALGLYFLISSTISIYETKFIRRRIDAEDKAREEFEKTLPPAEKRRLAATKDTAPTGFIGRIREHIDSRMKQAEKFRAEQERLKRVGKGGKSGKGSK